MGEACREEDGDKIVIVEDTLKSYRKCTRCPLHLKRRCVVLGRGTSPAPLLFIGEAPGFSEDTTGLAFFGRSGKLLNLAIERAAVEAKKEPPAHYITNLVGCIPTKWDAIKKRIVTREPSDDEILACRPRLRRTITLVKPQKIVLLGKPAQKEAGPFCTDALHLNHPAYILRRGGASSPDFRKFVRELGKVFKTIEGSRECQRPGKQSNVQSIPRKRSKTPST